MHNSHRYQYCFEGSGEGAESVFTVTAHGDLDCDGILSTFQMSWASDDWSTNYDCSMRRLGIFTENETE